MIMKLHQGLPVEKAREIFEREVGSITSAEIAELEQSLIDEGMSPDEVKKFCNVHALLFQPSLSKEAGREEGAAHPVQLFKLENREIEKITKALRELIENAGNYPEDHLRQRILDNLNKLKGIEIHYTRKEQLLFPFLEKYGFYGPSKVMWGKDNEIREMLKEAFLKINEADIADYLGKCLKPLVEEVEGMIFKEENILFPSSLEKLKAEDWDEILGESKEIGYVYIDGPKIVKQAREKRPQAEITGIKSNGVIFLPSGEMRLDELTHILNTLPVDITFVDKDDVVKYYSETKDRIFVRTKAVLGRKVQNCHPPQSVHVVEKILKSFKEGRRDRADFWINLNGRLIYIRYFAVRDKDRNYLGTLEVTQDITEIKKIEGERRLLSED
ncbi:MAG: DUF438 domain-containing protein [Candidatus Hadarchaeaceae archaeon]